MSKHANMFDYLETKAEVYRKLQDDFDSESRKMQIAMLGTTIAGVVGFATPEAHGAQVAFFVALMFALTGLYYFIDLSNRNFALHVIDWIEAAKNTGNRSRNSQNS